MNDMTQLKKETHSNPDDRLADFTDQVLGGKIAQTASNVDEELLALEETVLRLNKTFPPVQLPEASVKQMQVRLKARIKREAEKPIPSFWERLGIGNNRPQFVMAFSAIAVIVLLAVLLPGTTAGSSTAATAFSPSPILVAGGGLAVIVFILWIMRRK